MEAASTTAAKKTTEATIPTADMATSPAGTLPYRTTTTPTVAASGSSAAAIEIATAAAVHFDTQIEPRATGLEATQARVPCSRSVTNTPIDPKIAAMMKICDETAASRLATGSMVALADPVASG